MKNTRLILFLLALGAPFAVHSPAQVEAETPAPTASPADRDHAAVWALWSAQPPEADFFAKKPREAFLWQDKQMQAFAAAARDFARHYPSDPRRWDAIVQSSYTAPFYITGFAPDFDAHPGWGRLIQDQGRIAAFRAEQAKLFAALQASTDATTRARGGAYFALLTEANAAFAQDKSAANKAAYLALAAEFVDKVPDAAVAIAPSHLAFLKANGTPEDLAAFTAKLEASKDPAVQRMLAESRGDYSRFNGIADLKFTAADGRAVDLAQLRGKVVLVDFWATWCGPCKAEIPNVVANYDKYHAQGFEVIGVSLENPAAKPKDTPEQAAAKLEVAKDKMLAFTTENKMPWPQYYDGKWWKNDLATRFGIASIPAMVLLDQQGKIVSIEARGPELETELKRLLKL